MPESVAAIAAQWKSENSHRLQGGVVIVFNGQVQGWVNELRNPEHWRPGCLAISEDGFQWCATGGTPQRGARRWKLLPGKPKVQPPSASAGSVVAHTDAIIAAILEKPDINQTDISYALWRCGLTLSGVADELGCSKSHVHLVISGKRRSFDIATYIADKLNTTTTRLWGDAYNYTPRTGKQQLKKAANG